jgi:hypothetical protein
MVRGARYAFFALAWAFFIGLVVQVFVIGLALFSDSDFTEVHVNLGWILHLSPILVLIAAALGRVGRNAILLTVALVVVVFIVPILAILRDSSPVLAALHPVGALFAFGLSGAVARVATQIAFRDEPDGASPVAT